MERRLAAALFGALGTALLINLAVLLTARATDGGVSHDEERMLLITVGVTLALGAVSIAALVYAKIRHRDLPEWARVYAPFSNGY